jgi:acylphosphatase
VTAPGDLPRRWVVSGRVQGVGFRWFVLRRAEPLGLRGWVRNLPDGRVEVVAAGPAHAVESLDADLRTGPRLSRVDHVESNEYPHEVDLSKAFEVR